MTVKEVYQTYKSVIKYGELQKKLDTVEAEIATTDHPSASDYKLRDRLKEQLEVLGNTRIL